jgi:thioredoxin-like negative regulator of GroEL
MRTWRIRNLSAGLVALALAGAVFAQAKKPLPAAAPEDPWQTRLPAFSVDGPPRGEAPILLYFTAPWCGFCKQMERTTLADAEVAAQVAKLRAHKIDYDAQGGLVERFGVRGIPAFVLTNDRGEVIDRLTGATPKEAFLKWLAAGESASARAAQGAKERAAALAGILAELKSPDEARRRQALGACWKLAGRGDELERKRAAEALQTVLGVAAEKSEARTEAWRAGLAHADLAVRVAAANLLRETMADAAALYDPWADEPTRAAALAGVWSKL